jgi:DNA polymerase III epsilon subunit-like protein
MASISTMQNIISFSTATTGIPRTREPVTLNNLNEWPRITRLSYIISHSGQSVDIIITDVDMSKSTVPKSMISDNLRKSDESQKLPIAEAIKLFVDNCQESEMYNLFITHNAGFHFKILQAEMLRLGYDLKKIFRPGSIKCTMESNISFCALKRKNNTLKFPKLQELHDKIFPGDIYPETPISVDNAYYTLKCYQQQQLISSFEQLS